MIKKIKNRYALTDSGARGLVRASLSCFLMYVSFILPMMFLMYFAQRFIEGSLPSRPSLIIGILVVFALMYAVLHHNYNTLFTQTYRESRELRIEIAQTLKELPLSYFSKHDLSDLSQTVMKDVADIEHAMCHAIPQAIGFALYMLVIGTMMLVANFRLGLCVLLPVILSFVLLFLSKKMQVYYTTKFYHQLRENSESFQESIELQQEIKSYGQIDSVGKELKQRMENSEKLHIISEIHQALPVTLSSSVVRFSLGLTVFFGTILYMQGQAPLLYLLGYMMAATKIGDGVAGLHMNIAELMYIDARIQRIKELRNTPIQEGEPSEISRYDIEFKDVEFSYTKDKKVIDKISFIAKQGEVTALVGPSGCGKTSVLRLMSRLYDYDAGQIFIDNKELSSIDTDSLFEKISIVFQDVSLFNTSVMENIRLGRKDASDEEVIEAAKLANCHEFIEKLPEGYQSLIGENGSKLSGGERQRISIARAILKDAPIILLDEISASLDVENEMKIQESLNKLIKGKTVVIISHRLKSIEKADKIVVMNDGRLDCEGSHQYLLQHSKLYRTMIEKSDITENYVY
ncbi:MAG: ABC transporter ATP-binding protein [Filifactor alocis]|nr:ABC transporter ATP-binding protein [Filifactor alocis]